MLTNFTDTKVVRRDPKGEQTYISVRGHNLLPRRRVYVRYFIYTRSQIVAS